MSQPDATLQFVQNRQLMADTINPSPLFYQNELYMKMVVDTVGDYKVFFLATGK